MIREIKGPNKVMWVAYSDDVFHKGETDAGLVTHFPAGLDVEPFEETEEENYYQRLRAFAVPFEDLIGQYVEAGKLILYQDVLYEVHQPLTFQADWTPDIVPAHFNKIHEPLPGEEYPPWVQPLGQHDAYKLGDRVTHNGKNWECNQTDGNGNNVWEPGVFGWVEIP
jgi:hypothetical protein